ncbi:TetR family transcriptional regulator [Nocardioides convexus]|uniref:TetR/AcrR family transcriptional regulator n=1 Tax=Nocardioides convexus TaxID=2712224 RepID=UPI0024189581|nr:TetR family transcriptional regulator [Nocardioides convexus]
MTTAPARRTPADKHDERRRALAESALRTLGELGYARSSLREIANNSEFSHGVVHYYFTDKVGTDRPLRAALQGVLRAPLRRRGRAGDDGPGARRPLRRQSSWRPSSRRRRCTGSGTTCAPRACSRSRCARPSCRSTRRWST